ncbi:hypothetical protein FRC06_000208 [Ceratobasidium sp. 370]|nr:hypothetical protein FRC06_000208 [Ceratobasidium sp. 370]
MPSAAMPHVDATAQDIEDVSDTTSSIGSGDWTDLSSAHPDDVSDAASLDGDERARPVSSMGALEDGSEEAWTTAQASTSPAASLYASAHAPLNPFEHETSGAIQRPVHTPEAQPTYGMYGPLDPFRAPLDTDEGQSEQSHALSNVHDLQLILPDPLERSESTVAPDLSFSDDAVLATGPAIVVSLAGVPPSVAQRATVVADVLRAIAKATYSSYVRPDYRNFTTLSDLPKRVKVDQEHTKEISVLVCDHTNDPQNHPHDDAPSILVAFTSDLHHSHFPQIPIQSILVPVVVNDAAGPVVLFDEDRDDRAVDETAVDVDDLVRRLSNSLAADHHSETATQTAVDTFDGRSLVSDDLDEALLNTDYDTPDERSDRKLDEHVLPKHESAPRVIQDLAGPELADALKHAARSVSPRWATACAFAVMLSLLLGTGHLIRTARPGPSPTTAPTAVTILDPIPTAQTSLALRSPNTSLAPKSAHTSLALKSPHTALAVKSTQTALAKVSHVPINESCSSDISLSSSTSVAESASSSTTTSLSTTTPSTSTALSTTTPALTQASTSTCTETERARTLANVAEDLTGALDRVERLLGWNIRQTLGKAEAAGKAFADATNRANIAFEATAMEAAEVLYDSHQNARKNAQRKLATIKRGMNTWGEKVGLANSNEEAEAIEKEDVRGKTKNQGKVQEKRGVKGKKKAKENVKPRPGREKWQTSKDRPFRSERIVNKDKAAREEKAKGKSCEGKVPFPNREEQQRAQTAGRGKRPNQETWTWTVEEWTEYEPQGRPRTVMEEVREYIHHGFVF